MNSDVHKESIRRIIQYQKSLYWSSSSSSSSLSSAAASSISSFSLLELMKRGSTSLGRLFDMEHTSLLNHFQDYSGSPVTKSIPLWGSDTDGEAQDPCPYWEHIKQISAPLNNDFDTGGNVNPSDFASDGSFMDKDFSFNNRKIKYTNRRIFTRKKSFRRLPGFRFRFRLRLRRIRILICGRLF